MILLRCPTSPPDRQCLPRIRVRADVIGCIHRAHTVARVIARLHPTGKSRCAAGSRSRPAC
jgi:hypothetical protein